MSRLRGYMRRNRNVLVCWLYGSAACGRMRPESDIDLGVLLRRLPSGTPTAVTDLRLKMESELEDLLRRRVQLVFLNNADPILSRQVFRWRNVIFCRSEKARIEFEVARMRTYFDMQHRYDLMFSRAFK